MQLWHLPLSWHNEQTFDGFIMMSSSFTIRSTVSGIDLSVAQANRLTDIEAMSENCGEYIRLLFPVYIGIPPAI
jgi:hypothetical protein